MAVLGDLSFSSSVSLGTSTLSATKAPLTAIATNLAPAITRSWAVSVMTPNVGYVNKTLALGTPVSQQKPTYGIDSGVGADPSDFYGPPAAKAGPSVGYTEQQAESAGKPPWALIAAAVGIVLAGVVVLKAKKKRR